LFPNGTGSQAIGGRGGVALAERRALVTGLRAATVGAERAATGLAGGRPDPESPVTTMSSATTSGCIATALQVWADQRLWLTASTLLPSASSTNAA
jgi:hypothetical protein